MAGNKAGKEKMMPKFYFTYGTEGQPYYGGWTEISAPDIDIACALFRAVHPDRTEGYLNCSSIYPEKQFLKSVMAEKGNFGYFCHETITVTITKNERSSEK